KIRRHGQIENPGRGKKWRRLLIRRCILTPSFRLGAVRIDSVYITAIKGESAAFRPRIPSGQIRCSILVKIRAGKRQWLRKILFERYARRRRPDIGDRYAITGRAARRPG